MRHCFSLRLRHTRFYPVCVNLLQRASQWLMSLLHTYVRNKQPSVDTKTITHAGGPEEFHVAVIGNPCLHEVWCCCEIAFGTWHFPFPFAQERLDEPFVQPFDGRKTTIRRDGIIFVAGSLYWTPIYLHNAGYLSVCSLRLPMKYAS